MYEKSKILLDNANKYIPEQTMTFAKKSDIFFKFEDCPKYITKANGCILTDVDGNNYIDYMCSLGAIILGHSYPSINDSIKNQLEKGTLYSLPHESEVELAELLVNTLKYIDMVRFYKNGADSTGMAIRLARSYTKKNHIIRCGYHGNHEWSSYNIRDGGILDEIKNYTHSIKYGENIDEIEKIINQNDVACIIVATTFTTPDINFYKNIRDICTKYNIIMISDEMWSGFRFNIGGMCEFANIEPDLVTFGKAVANGFPLSILAGKENIMNYHNKIWAFSTYGGETLSIRSAINTIKEIKNNNVIEYINNLGQYLRYKLYQLKKSSKYDFEIQGHNSLIQLICDNELHNRIQKKFCENGILWNKSFVLSFSHTKKEIDKTISILEGILNI